MIIKSAVILIEIIVAYLLQTAVFSNLRLADVVPDIFIILTASIAYMSGKKAGAITGFLCGLLLDLTFGSLVGVYALIYTIIGYFCGYANMIYSPDDYTLPMFIIGGAEFIYNLFYFVFFYLLMGKINLGYFSIRFLFPRVIYTVLVSIIHYRLLNFNFKLFDGIDRRKRLKNEGVIEYESFDFIDRRSL